MRGGFATYNADAEQHFNGLALETSSGSSSPNSSSSNEELQVVDRSETGLTSRSKPLYNFSIPDIIKHDRSTSVGSGIARSHEEVVRGDSIGSDCIQTLKRRRTAEEDGPSRIVPRSRNGGDGITRSSKQRRTGTGASAGGFHPVIDLTTTPDSPDIQPIHLLDDSTDVHSDSEVSVTGLETRTFETPLTTPSLDDDSIECIRRRLRETQQESARLMRDAQSRLSRVRRRISRLSPRVITDGPVYDYSAINGFNHGGQSDSRRQRSYLNDDPPVINLDQDGSLSNVTHDQNGSAQRTAESAYSPRYLPQQEITHPSDLAPAGNVASVNTQTRDQELSRLREQVSHFQQQVRERYEAAQARLQRLRYIVRERGNDLPYPLRRPPHVNLENESGGQDGSEDEVEIVHEWRRSYQGSGQSSRASGTEGNRVPSVGNYGRLGHRRNTAIFYPHRLPGIPDFLLPVVFSPVTAPPLHHYPPGSGTMLEGEDYEALWSLAERIGPAKPRGLCKAAIGQIPSFRFSASNASETNTTCVVCMCEYTNREKLRKLPCSHDFHSKCIDKWLKSNRTCPVCRDEVKVKTQ